MFEKESKMELEAPLRKSYGTKIAAAALAISVIGPGNQKSTSIAIALTPKMNIGILGSVNVLLSVGLRKYIERITLA